MHLPPDGNSLISASTDQSVKVWDVAAGKELATLHGHTKSINAIAIGSDGKTFYTASGDATVKAWNFSADNARRQSWKHDGSSYGFAVSPDGKTAATAAWLGKLRLWNMETGEQIAVWQAHVQSANAVAFSPDGKRLASVGNDNKVKLWDLLAVRNCGSSKRQKAISSFRLRLVLTEKQSWRHRQPTPQRYGMRIPALSLELSTTKMAQPTSASLATEK
ncbi:MAG: PD40 domain-containing protein [Acidobacteria bacterium]|nr:PD40 domain-containing protein [Acidobacteriota bacterium]